MLGLGFSLLLAQLKWTMNIWKSSKTNVQQYMDGQPLEEHVLGSLSCVTLLSAPERAGSRPTEVLSHCLH